jgi:hypothetical protein
MRVCDKRLTSSKLLSSTAAGLMCVGEPGGRCTGAPVTGSVIAIRSTTLVWGSASSAARHSSVISPAPRCITSTGSVLCSDSRR